VHPAQQLKIIAMGQTYPAFRKATSVRLVLFLPPEVEKFIRMCLDADTAEVLRNQTLTAKRIYDRLVPELSFPDSYSIERRAVHEMRAQYLSAQQNGYPTP
jgi:hypothetical protein